MSQPDDRFGHSTGCISPLYLRLESRGTLRFRRGAHVECELFQRAEVLPRVIEGKEGGVVGTHRLGRPCTNFPFVT